MEWVKLLVAPFACGITYITGKVIATTSVEAGPSLFGGLLEATALGGLIFLLVHGVRVTFPNLMKEHREEREAQDKRHCEERSERDKAFLGELERCRTDLACRHQEHD